MGRKRSLSVDDFTVKFKERNEAQRESRRVERVLSRYAKESYKQYLSDIKYICACSDATGNISTDQTWFSSFVDVQLSEGVGAEVVGRLKAAYRVWLVLNGVELDEVLWISLGWEIAGVKRAANELKVPRGAIGFDKLLQVIEVAHELGHSLYTAGFLLAFSACLRHAHVMTLKVSDVLFDGREQDDVVLRLRFGNKDKFPSSGGARQSYPRTAFGCKNLLMHVTLGRGDSELLFPFWDRKVANWIIRTTSIKCGWDSSQTWEGLHPARRQGHP